MPSLALALSLHFANGANVGWDTAGSASIKSMVVTEFVVLEKIYSELQKFSRFGLKKTYWRRQCSKHWKDICIVSGREENRMYHMLRSIHISNPIYALKTKNT